jgi:hypothetical protein
VGQLQVNTGPPDGGPAAGCEPGNEAIPDPHRLIYLAGQS